MIKIPTSPQPPKRSVNNNNTPWLPEAAHVLPSDQSITSPESPSSFYVNNDSAERPFFDVCLTTFPFLFFSLAQSLTTTAYQLKENMARLLYLKSLLLSLWERYKMFTDSKDTPSSQRLLLKVLQDVDYTRSAVDEIKSELTAMKMIIATEAVKASVRDQRKCIIQ